jgi:hypothetical protein
MGYFITSQNLKQSPPITHPTDKPALHNIALDSPPIYPE